MANEKIYLTAKEVSEILGISLGHAYKLVQKMNEELSSKGYLVIAGKIPVQYMKDRYYGFTA